MLPRASVAILGPVEVVADDRQVVLVRSRLRATIGLLALTPGRVVSVERLVDGMYGDEPPPSVIRTLHAHMSHLRRALEGLGLREIVRTRAPGYLLDAGPDGVDAAVFEREVAHGRKLLTQAVSREAVDVLGRALALWRARCWPTARCTAGRTGRSNA